MHFHCVCPAFYFGFLLIFPLEATGYSTALTLPPRLPHLLCQELFTQPQQREVPITLQLLGNTDSNQHPEAKEVQTEQGAVFTHFKSLPALH